MNTNTSSTKTDATTTESMCCPAAYADLFNKGLERVVAEVSKTSLDLAVEQNAKALDSFRKALSASGVSLFDLAGQTLDSYITLQRDLLELAVMQSTAVLEAAQEYSHDASKVIAGIADAIQPSVDSTVAAQESVLELAPKQTKTVSDTAKQQSGVIGMPVQTVQDIVQLRADALLAKEIVDRAVQPGVIGTPVEAVADIIQLRVDMKKIVDRAKPLKATDIN